MKIGSKSMTFLTILNTNAHSYLLRYDVVDGTKIDRTKLVRFNGLQRLRKIDYENRIKIYNISYNTEQ